MRRGIKTTELLVTAATQIAVLASALQGSLSPKWAAIAAAISATGYSISRGLTKAGGAEAFTALAAEPAAPADPIGARKAELEAELAKLASSP